ncbi:MAG: type II secretion system F family protein [Actinobacteria bacterium]|nr:type II secretion system F family protein [Actinomycetota bacterium]
MDERDHLAHRIMISLIAIAGVVGLYFFYRQQRTPEPNIARSVPEMIDTLLVLVRAGHGPVAAISQLHNWVPTDIKPPLYRAHVELAAGQRFGDVIKKLRNDLGPGVFPVCDILASADRDGLPITSILDQLSFHSHRERQRLREIETKELPVRLLFPLVCCILPSFVLLAMLPLLINSLTVVSGQLW